ncbi:hypothetical protein KKG36_02900 [Patescibacteria group bacterium]|nr:hypothetical protein [Patescibacteria group bacterium]
MKGNAQQLGPGELREFFVRLLAAVPLDIPPDEARFWLGNPGLLGEAMRRVLVVDQMMSWEYFYRRHFDIALGGVSVPARKPGSDRLIVVAQGVTCNQAFDACQKCFPCWRVKADLDTGTVNDRNPTQAYAVWVRCTNQASKCITLLEGLLLMLKHWDDTHDRLDVDGHVFCPGSQFPGGIPHLRWDSMLRVYWCGSRDQWVGSTFSIS